MGRPRSAQGKSVIGSLRITPQEEEILVARFGSVNRGLRAGVDLLLARAKGVATAPAPRPPEPGEHRHRQGPTLLRADYDRGVRTEYWSCAEEGCTKEVVR